MKMGVNSRPGFGEQSWGDGVAGGKGSRNHGAVKHGNEEDLRVEKGLQSIDEGVPAFAVFLLSVEEGKIVLPGAWCVVFFAVLVSGDAACAGPRQNCNARRGVRAVENLLISDLVRSHLVSGRKKKTPIKKKPAAIAVI